MANYTKSRKASHSPCTNLENIVLGAGFNAEQTAKLLRLFQNERDNVTACLYGATTPHAPDIEDAVIGAIIAAGSLAAQARAANAVLHTIKSYLPTERCFYLAQNQVIYRAILELDAEQMGIDQLTVTQHLKQSGTLDAAGGIQRILELADRIASTTNVETWARILFEQFQQRELIATCTRTIKDIHERKGDIYTIAEQVNRATRINSPNSLLRTANMDDDIIAGAHEKPKRRVIGDLIREREVSILFSDEKTGKTILALQFAIAAAKGENLFGRPDLFPNECEPMKVQIFDFEMENRELYDRYSDPSNGEMYNFGPNVIRTIMNPECFDLKAAPERLIAAVEAEIEKHQPKFVIIDNITWLVKESTDADVAAEFMGKMLQLQRRHEMSVVVIAHTPKRNTAEPLESRNLAGSKNLVNFCKNLIGVAASRKDKPIRYIKHIFSRNSPVIYDESNVIECGIEKEPGSSLLQWKLMGFSKELEHLTVPEQEHTEDEILEMVFNRRQNNMSYEQIRKDLCLNWHKTTIIRKLAAWEDRRKGTGTLLECEN
jgi:hypothetical protein